MKTLPFFFNQCLDKKRLKKLILWSLSFRGEYKTLRMIEELKTLGFQYATSAGVSLSIDDLSIPPKKRTEILDAEALILQSVQGRAQGNRTAVEELQNVVDTWHRTSEAVKDHVIEFFEATNILNPVYMMAFSGARGNVSQVRQLVGMRGLMADPKGDIIGYAIRSNFREGLTITEYMISAYGARKGVVDTALRTADAGYLTRRLVDVAQHIVVQQESCGTDRGILLQPIMSGGKVVLESADRLLGRVLAHDVYTGEQKLASRNEAIDSDLAYEISHASEVHSGPDPKTGAREDGIYVRSPLTCALNHGVCQLCYGWSFAQNRLVPIGEAVGVMAGQSIGEPGTQLTMRTFHTGGVFTGEVQDEFRAPHGGIIHYPKAFPGLLVRTPYGQIGFLVKESGTLVIKDGSSRRESVLHVPTHTALFLREGEKVCRNQILALAGGLDEQGNDRVETRKSVFSEFAGEVYFENCRNEKTLFPEKLSVRLKRLEAEEKRKRKKKPLTVAEVKKERSRLAKKCDQTSGVGTIWILAGRTLDPTHKALPVFQSSGQLVKTDTLLGRHAVLLPTEGFIVRDREKEPAKEKPVLLPRGPQYRLDQQIDEKVPVTTIESGNLASAADVRIYQPHIYSPYTKVRFDSLQNSLAIGEGKGDTFVIPNYTKQINDLDVDLQKGAEDDRRSLPPQDLSILYFQAADKVEEAGAFLWRQALFADTTGTHGLCFVTPQTAQKATPWGFYGRTVRDAWTRPGSAKTRLVRQLAKGAKGRRRASLFPWQKDDRLASMTKKRDNAGAIVGATRTAPTSITAKRYSKIEAFYCPAGEAFGLEPNLQGQGQLLTAKKAGVCIRSIVEETKKGSLITPTIHERNLGEGATQEPQRYNPREGSREGLEGDIRLQFPFGEEGHGYQSLQDSDLSHESGWFYLPRHRAFGHPHPQFHGQRVTSRALVMTTEYAQGRSQHTKMVEGLAQKVGINAITLTQPEEESAATEPRLRAIRRLLALRHPRVLPLIRAQAHEELMQETVASLIPISHSKNPWYWIFGTEESRLAKAAGRFTEYQFGLVFSPLMLDATPTQRALFGALNNETPKARPSKYTERPLRSLVLLYQPIREFSLDRIAQSVKKFDQGRNFELTPMATQQALTGPAVRDDLTSHSSLYQAFQAAYSKGEGKMPTVRMNKSVTRAVWTKQSLSPLVPKVRPARSSMKALLVPNRSYLDQPGFVCRFLVQCKASLEKKEKVGGWKLGWTPPWYRPTDGVTGATVTISFVKPTRIQTRADEIFYPSATWLMYGDPYTSRRKRVGACGEVYRTVTHNCTLLDKKDMQTFAFSRPMAAAKVGIGDLVRFGDEIEAGVGVPAAGEVIAMTPTTITIRKGQPILFTNSGSTYVKDSQCVAKGHPLVTLSYQRLITGDIVQGIPKVEQLFEGAKSGANESGVSLAALLVKRYRRLKHVEKVPANEAFGQSVRMIQDKLIENIQKVYLSQGVHLADIHFEIIIRRITSWGKVRITGDSGLFRHEVMPLHRLEKVNNGVDGKKAVFIPTIVGITAAARDSESFLSAASFQESSRVLARDVLAGKTDFLRGIKERVILGDLIPAGTGFKEHIAYTAKLPKLRKKLK